MSSTQIKQRMERERLQALKRLQKTARKGHKGTPKTLPADWENSVIEVCLARLKYLDTIKTPIPPPAGEQSEQNPEQNTVLRVTKPLARQEQKGASQAPPPTPTVPGQNKKSSTGNHPSVASRKSNRLQNKRNGEPMTLDTIQEEANDQGDKSDDEEDEAEEDNSDEGRNKEDTDEGEDTDLKVLSEEKWPKRHGRLSKKETQEVRERGKEVMELIYETAQTYGVNTGTIMEIMELGVSGQRRKQNHWNKFEAVYWHELLLERKQDVVGDVDDGTIKSSLKKLEYDEQHAKCVAEYNKLMRSDMPKKDLGEDDLKAIEDVKQDIEKRYDELFSNKPGEGRKYGDVARIMDNARKELSQYVNVLHKQGVGVGGFCVSLDDDPATSLHNFAFAGGPSGQGYFAMKKANLKVIMSEYELYGKYGDLQAKESSLSNEGDWDDYQFYVDHVVNPDKMLTRVSMRVLELQKSISKRGLKRMVWKKLGQDCVANFIRIKNYPEGIPPPGMNRPFKNDFGRKVLDIRKLLAGLTGYNSPKIAIEPWTDIEIELYQRGTCEQMKNNEEWRSICIVRSVGGSALVTLGQMTDIQLEGVPVDTVDPESDDEEESESKKGTKRKKEQATGKTMQKRPKTKSVQGNEDGTKDATDNKTKIVPGNKDGTKNLVDKREVTVEGTKVQEGSANESTNHPPTDINNDVQLGGDGRATTGTPVSQHEGTKAPANGGSQLGMPGPSIPMPNYNSRNLFHGTVANAQNAPYGFNNTNMGFTNGQSFHNVVNGFNANGGLNANGIHANPLVNGNAGILGMNGLTNSNGLVPTNGFMPTNSGVPTANGLVPTNGFVPTHGFVPNNGFGPTNGFAPTNNGFAATNNGFAPTNNGFTLTNNGFAPTNHGFAPTNHGFAPTNHGFAPTNYGFAPTNHGLAATNGCTPTSGFANGLGTSNGFSNGFNGFCITNGVANGNRLAPANGLPHNNGPREGVTNGNGLAPAPTNGLPNSNEIINHDNEYTDNIPGLANAFDWEMDRGAA